MKEVADGQMGRTGKWGLRLRAARLGGKPKRMGGKLKESRGDYNSN